MLEKIVKYIINDKYRFTVNSYIGINRIMTDEKYLKKKYYVTLGKKLNLEYPKSLNEKLQWLKIYDREQRYIQMVDKIDAKKYVASIIGWEHIIPTLGVWDSFDDIDFDKLPNQFVLKCNHDSGGLVIVKDKSKLDISEARTIITRSLKNNYYYNMREWPYKNVKPKVFAEQYIDCGEKGITDYKFFNFNGESRFLYISEGLNDHSSAKMSFYNFEGIQMPFKRSDYKSFDHDYALPSNFKIMHQLSDTLARTINAPFVRTDFYSVSGSVYFSEITFFPCGGMIPFDPPEWDEKLGELLDISDVRNDK